MPVTLKKSGNRYRVVEKSTGRVAKTKLGNARDGGGHADKAKGMRQVRAMNSSRFR